MSLDSAWCTWHLETMKSSRASTEDLAALVRKTAEANTALLRGDIERYAALVNHADDFTLMAPFGGKPTRGFDRSSEHVAELKRFFRSGEGELELVEAYGTRDMVALALIERQHAEVGGMPDQEWSLRVTLVYRRDGSRWQLVHRHADPLVNGVTLEQAAAIARAP